MNAAPQWMAAVRMALRAAPAGCEVRIDVADERTTVRLCDAAGDVAVCSIRRAAPAPKDARQVTLDEVIARRAAASPAPPAPAADTPPEPAAAPPATVADDLGEDGREFPDGEPYAELRVVRSDWLHHRRALGDVVGGAHHGDWRPDGDHRTLVVSRSQLDKIIGALGVHSAILDVTRLGPTPRPPTRPASSPLQQLWVAASEWASLSPEVRDELGEHVRDGWRREGDWYTDTPYADAAVYVYDKLCREGVAVHLEPPPAPAPAKKPAKASKKLYRDQGHELDKPWAHPNTAWLAGPGEDLERPKGLNDAAWRALVAQTITEAPAATWRLYSAKGKCLWDSRDGGAP